MRIKDVRQGLHTLLHTQGLDGLLHLYKRLEKRGRALLLCLLCAEAGWLILVNAWLRLERAYLKLRLFLRVVRNQEQKWGGPRCAAASFRSRHTARRGYAGREQFPLLLQFFDPTPNCSGPRYPWRQAVIAAPRRFSTVSDGAMTAEIAARLRLGGGPAPR